MRNTTHFPEIPKPEALLVVHADMGAIRAQENDPKKIERIMRATCERIDFYRRNNRPVIISRYMMGKGEDEMILQRIPQDDIIEWKGARGLQGNTVHDQSVLVRRRMKEYRISVLEVIGGWRNCCLVSTIKELLHPEKRVPKPPVNDIVVHHGADITLIENQKYIF